MPVLGHFLERIFKMAIRSVCSVWDSAVRSYGQPIFVPATAAAVRSFQDEIRRGGQDNLLASHPEDFELHHIADFDDDTGGFVSVGPLCLIRGKDAVAQEK